MNLLQKFKETVFSVVPVMGIVLLLGVTAAPLDTTTIIRFLSGGVLLIIGLTIFLLGVDIGILPTGERSGAALTSKRSLPLLLCAAFIIGVIVTIAEPDVQVLADQIKNVAAGINRWLHIFMIAAGLGFFVMLGLLRTVLSVRLKYILIISYTVVFALAFLCPAEFQGVAFDAGGATTGPMTVPFIMALGVGVATVRAGITKKGQDSSDDSFGLTGMASIGPILAVCVYGILSKILGAAGSIQAADMLQSSDAVAAQAGSLQNAATAIQEAAGAVAAQTGALKDAAASITAQTASSLQNTSGLSSTLGIFVELIRPVFNEVTIALLPLVVMFIVFQIFLLKMPPVQLRRMFKGLLYSFIGLLLFLVGVKGGFMDAGRILGETLGNRAHFGGFWLFLLTATGIIFGAVVVCAEPAVYVLTEQVENVSGGTIKKSVMLAAFSAGVALSVGISMLRAFYGFSLWYILVPGYALALILTFFSPPLFTGIAFDSGGVASGPMTSTFILSFALGAASGGTETSSGQAFGVIALVAMTPLITIQILGIIFKIKTRKKSKEALS